MSPHHISCSVRQAVDWTGLGRDRLYQLMGAGELAYSHVGKRRLILVASLRELVERGTTQRGRPTASRG